MGGGQGGGRSEGARQSLPLTTAGTGIAGGWYRLSGRNRQPGWQPLELAKEGHANRLTELGAITAFLIIWYTVAMAAFANATRTVPSTIRNLPESKRADEAIDGNR